MLAIRGRARRRVSGWPRPAWCMIAALHEANQRRLTWRRRTELERPSTRSSCGVAPCAMIRPELSSFLSPEAAPQPSKTIRYSDVARVRDGARFVLPNVKLSRCYKQSAEALSYMAGHRLASYLKTARHLALKVQLSAHSTMSTFLLNSSIAPTRQNQLSTSCCPDCSTFSSFTSFHLK